MTSNDMKLIRKSVQDTIDTAGFRVSVMGRKSRDEVLLEIDGLKHFLINLRANMKQHDSEFNLIYDDIDRFRDEIASLEVRYHKPGQAKPWGYSALHDIT